MNEQMKTGKALITVLLTSGDKCDHVYDAPLSWEEGEKMINMIFDALDKRKFLPLLFTNPDAVYNPDNVSGIQFHFVKSEEIEQFRKQANRKIGLVKD